MDCSSTNQESELYFRGRMNYQYLFGYWEVEWSVIPSHHSVVKYCSKDADQGHEYTEYKQRQFLL